MSNNVGYAKANSPITQPVELFKSGRVFDRINIMKIKIEQFAKEKLGKDAAAGFDHFSRNYAVAKKLAKLAKMSFDDEVLHAACFMHDIEDSSGDPHNLVAAKIAGRFLKKIKFPTEKIPAVQWAIKEHLATEKPQSNEAILLHDADLLDFLGATGIVRLSIGAWDWMEKYSLKEFLPIFKKFKNDSYKNLVLKESRKLANQKMKFMETAIKELERELK